MTRKVKRETDLSTNDISIFDSSAPERDTQQLVWAEVNVLALPFAVLDEREAKTSSGHEIIKFDKQNEKQVIWLWRVWPDPKVGMPTMSTMRVLFALMELAEEANYPYRLEFSLSEICKRVGFKVDGRHRAMVRNHIEILASTQCKSKGAFKDKKKNGLFIDTFKYIRQAAFVGEIVEGGTKLDKNFVVFDDPVRLNLESKYIKQIDVAMLRKVKSPIGQLLYTKLSNAFHDARSRGEAHATLSYAYLAERMGITVYDQPFRAKAQLKQAISELQKLHYIEDAQWDQLTIRFTPGVRYQFGEERPLLERKRTVQTKTKILGTTPFRAIPKSTNHEPLIPLCALYSEQGWKLAEAQANRKGLTEEQVRAECLRLGLAIAASS